MGSRNAMPLVACCRYCGSSLGGEHLGLCPLWVAGYEQVIEADVRLMSGEDALALAVPLRRRAREMAGLVEEEV